MYRYIYIFEEKIPSEKYYNLSLIKIPYCFLGTKILK